MGIADKTLQVGRLLEKRKHWRLASATYKAIRLTIPSKKQEAQFRVAYSQFQINPSDQNTAAMEIVAFTQHGDSSWYYQLGFSHERLKNWHLACNSYLAAIEAGPGQAKYFYRLAVCLDHLKEHRKALEYYRKSLVLDPQNSRTFNRLVDCTYRTSPAWQQLKTLREGDQSDLLNRKNKERLASLLYKFGKYQESAATYEELANSAQEGQGVFWFRGYLSLNKLDNSDRAREFLTNSLASPSNLDVDRFGVGAYYQEDGYWLEAAWAYQEKLTTRPEDPELLYRAALANDRGYRWSAAEQYYRKAIALNKHRSGCQDRLGFVIERYSGPSVAIDFYEQSVRENSISRKTARLRLARLYAEVGRYHDAWMTLDLSEELGNIAPSQIVNNQSARETEEQYSEPQETRAYHVISEARKYAIDGDFGRAINEAFSDNPAFLNQGVSYPKTHKSKALINQSHYASFIERFPLVSNQVLLETNHGNSITCNPHSMYLEMRSREEYADFKFIWVTSQDTIVPKVIENDENVILVERESTKYFYYLATSKYLINNTSFGPYLVRRPNQKYLNTWHGTPLKTIGSDVKEATTGGHSNIARNLRVSTHLLSQNQYTIDKLLASNGLRHYEGMIANTGYPRTDSTLNINSIGRTQLRSLLGISEDDDRPIVLYAPTWRGTLESKSIDSESIASDLDSLASPRYHMLFRGHHFTEALILKNGLGHNVVDRHIDTNDLLAVTDVLITDYSSIFFDYLPSNRPVLFYVPDLEEYSTNRGLYLDLPTESPSVIQSISALKGWLLEHDFDNNFCVDPIFDKDIYCPNDDGNASARAVDFFINDIFGDTPNLSCSKDNPTTRKISLLIRQSLIANGITAALANLLNVIDPSVYSVTLLLDSGATAADESRVQNLQRIPSHVEIVWRNGRMITTPEQQWLINKFNLLYSMDSAEKFAIYIQAFRTEYRRIFGDRTFDYAIEYDGYSTFWASLMLAAPTKFGSYIYMHANMDMEQKDKFPELSGVFHLYQYFKGLVSVSKAICAENCNTIASLHNIETDKFITATNVVNWAGIDLKSHDPLDTYISSFMNRFSTVFLCVGRLSPEKGHDKLLRAFSKVNNPIETVGLIIVGDGPLRNETEELVEALELGGSVLMTGALDNPFSVMRSSSCLVLPSDHEGLGLVVLEAKHIGIPVIATDIPGPREILAEGRGILAVNSVDGLSVAMNQFIESKAVQVPMSIAEFNRIGAGEFTEIFTSYDESL